MANGILDALSKHSMFSETLDTLNRDPSTAHQMKGFDFAQNFPGAVPGGVYTPTSFLGPMLSKGYQYGQEIGNALLDGPGNYTVGQAIKNAGIQSDANIQGMLGRGFDMDTYNQNVKDFNIADVNFANSFGLDNLFGSSAMADELDEPIDVENFLEANRLNSTPDVVDVNRIPGRIQEAVEPQYRIRNQLSRDFLQGGLFRDAKKGLGQTKNALLDDFGQLREGLGSITNKGMNLFGLAKDKGIDLGRTIASGIGRYALGPIGGILGSLIGSIKESPTDKFNLEIGKEVGDPYGYKGQLSSGTMGGRQDPFGRNLVSAFGNYEKNRMAEVARLNALATRNKFQQAQLDFGKDYLNKLEAKRQAAIQERQAQNRADNTGGYQAGYSSDFMDGPSGTIGGQNQGLGGQQGKAGGTATMGSS